MTEAFKDSQHQFIIQLANAWKSPDTMFLPSEEETYKNTLIDFCNSTHDYCFSEADFDIIFNFLSKSIRNYLSLYSDSTELRPQIIEDTLFILNLVRYMALYWKNKYSRSFFSNTLTFLISFPVSEDISDEKVALLFDYYEKSHLFISFCELTSQLTTYSIDKDLLIPFMRRIRKLPQLNLFSFYLYQFNDSFFRHQIKIYPDECPPDVLFSGIKSGYFISRGFLPDCISTLKDLCQTSDPSILKNRNFDNPLYVIWQLYLSGNISSIKDYSQYFELLFTI